RRLVDSREVLVDDPPRAEVQVTHLGIPHLPLGESDRFPAGRERGARVAREERVHDRRARKSDGVSFRSWIEAPAVEDDEAREASVSGGHERASLAHAGPTPVGPGRPRRSWTRAIPRAGPTPGKSTRGGSGTRCPGRR